MYSSVAAHSGGTWCPLKERHIRSLDFVVNRLSRKSLKTCEVNVVKVCQDLFKFELPSVNLIRRSLGNSWSFPWTTEMLEKK